MITNPVIKDIQSCTYKMDKNLFNPNAPYGNWAIDESLAKMAHKGRHELIIVAIDHGEEERITEYLPFEEHPRFGDGGGKKYVDFLVDDLIPHCE